MIIQRLTRIRLDSSDMGSDCDDDRNIIGDKLFVAMWDSRQLPTRPDERNWFSRHANETECRLHSRRAAFFVQSTGNWCHCIVAITTRRNQQNWQMSWSHQVIVHSVWPWLCDALWRVFVFAGLMRLVFMPGEGGTSQFQCAHSKMMC